MRELDSVTVRDSDSTKPPAFGLATSPAASVACTNGFREL